MFSDAELFAYLDEDLEAGRMTDIEHELRADPALHKRLMTLRTNTSAGNHSLGAIWQSHHISCPNREDLGNFLLGIMPPEQKAFVKTHLEINGCRRCQANVDDLQQQSEAQVLTQNRRQRYFQSSAGYLSQQ
jgi:anti-sigma factor RsiW